MKVWDTVVVGAGISGLSLAYRLKRSGLEVMCIDPQPPGGVIQTLNESGFLVERGPNSTMESCRELTQLVEDLGIESDRIYPSQNAKNRFIVKNEKLVALPMSPLAFLSSSLFSLSAKLRIMVEPFKARGPGGESLGDFVTRRLGSEFLDYAINPFVAGVYAGHPNHLSVEAGFPRLHGLEREYGSLFVGAIRGARARRKSTDVAKDRARLVSFRQGMSHLPKALATALGESIVEDRVSSVAVAGDTFLVNTVGLDELKARSVALCIPAQACATLLHRLDVTASRSLKEIHYPPVTSVALGFKQSDVTHPLNGFGFLVPEVEQRLILGCIFSSNLFAGRAPDGHVLLTSFVGGVRQPALTGKTESEMVGLVLSELRSLLGVRSSPVFHSVTSWKAAIPQYDLGHMERMKLLAETEEAIPGLFFRSNYKDGISVADCVKAAHVTSERVHEYLKHSSIS